MGRLRASIAPHDSAKRFSEELGIDVFIGKGQFLDGSTVQVNGQKLRFAKAVVATGGTAAVPPISGLKEAGYLTNSTVFNLTKLPKRLAVIGSGAIGCELAQCFARFGSQVTLLFRSGQIMSREDPDAVKLVMESFQKDGVRLWDHSKTEKVEYDETKGEKVLFIERNGKKVQLQVDEILVATGRKPNVEGLGLEKAGIKYDKRLGITVNDTLQTSNSNVFAVGDVATRYQFTHVSDWMARLVIRNALFFGKGKMSGLIIPWCTYTDPEIAHVGLYEKDLKQKNIKYDVFEKQLHDNDRAILESQTNGFVKVFVKHGSDKILGATIVAAHAGDMISELTTCMVGKIGLGTLATVIHPYPTQAESLRALGDEYNRTRLTPTVKLLFRKWLSTRR